MIFLYCGTFRFVYNLFLRTCGGCGVFPVFFFKKKRKIQEEYMHVLCTVFMYVDMYLYIHIYTWETAVCVQIWTGNENLLKNSQPSHTHAHTHTHTHSLTHTHIHTYHEHFLENSEPMSRNRHKVAFQGSFHQFLSWNFFIRLYWF